MKILRTITAALAAAALISASIPAFADTIYDLTEETTIATGIVQKNIKRLTTDGWQNINIVEADLASGRYGVKTLTNPDDLSKLTNVQALAEAHGTLAAVNGDFFSWKWNDKSQGSAIGGVIVDGQLVTSPTSPWNFATVAQSADGSFIFDYIDCSISVTTPNGAVTTIEHINKYDDLTQPVIYTKEWGALSPGSTGTQVEIVVENNVVTSINYDCGPAEIPENGYIIAFLSDISTAMLYNFHEGDELALNIGYWPTFENINFAVGAGTLLLKDGQHTEITNNIAGNQPRTAIGVNEDNSKFYMVTVDGRQDNAKGVTLTEFADILLELGIDDAANLDGGGSTTLVTKTPETAAQDVVNSPSDNYLRPVANGVGLVPAAPADNNGFITIEPDTDTVFLGTTTYLNPHVYDSLGNLIDASESIAWITTEGTVSDGYYTPHTAGMHTITASWNGVTATKEIRVSDKPVKLSTGHKEYNIGIGDRAYISLLAIDKDGYKSYINLSDTDISISSHILQLDGNTVIGREPGTAVITFNFKGLQASAAVRVGGDSSIVTIPEDVSLPFIGSTLQNTQGAFKLAVFGSTADKSTLLKRLAIKKYTQILNTGICDAAIFTDFNTDFPQGVATRVLNLSGYNVYPYDGATIITMDNGNISHWSRFVSTMNSISTKNVFLLLPESINDDSAYQEEMLIDIAEKRGINLHIISSGSGDIISDSGIKHISVPGLETINNASSVVQDAQYRLFTIVNGEVYCETVNMYNYR